MPTPEQPITICGIEELPRYANAGDLLLTLLNPSECEGHKDVWARFYGVTHEILQFDDVTRPCPEACQPHHIDRLLAFGERIPPDAHLIIHCHAGISRSPAAAAVLMCQHARGREEEAFMRLRQIRPKAWPNERVVQLADDAMGRDGALMAALEIYREAKDG